MSQSLLTEPMYKPTPADGIGFEEFVPDLTDGHYGVTAGGKSEALLRQKSLEETDKLEYFHPNGASGVELK